MSESDDSGEFVTTYCTDVRQRFKKEMDRARFQYNQSHAAYGKSQITTNFDSLSNILLEGSHNLAPDRPEVKQSLDYIKSCNVEDNCKIKNLKKGEKISDASLDKLDDLALQQERTFKDSDCGESNTIQSGGTNEGRSNTNILIGELHDLTKSNSLYSPTTVRVSTDPDARHSCADIIDTVPDTDDRHCADTKTDARHCADSIITVPDSNAEARYCAENIITVPDIRSSEGQFSGLNDSDDEFLYLVPDRVLDNTEEIGVEFVEEVSSRPYTRRRKRSATECTSRKSSRRRRVVPRSIEVPNEDKLATPESSDIGRHSVVDDEFNYETNVKVMWKSVNLIRIPVRRLQKFSILFEYFSNLENVPIERIFLTLHGKPLKPNDTPHSINLDICDFVEGGVVNTNITNASSAGLKQNNSSSFHIKFQTQKGTIKITGLPTDKFAVFMVSYAEQAELPLDAIRFEFDGEPVSSHETPKQMDLGSGDVIDVLSV